MGKLLEVIVALTLALTIWALAMGLTVVPWALGIGYMLGVLK
jgi:hypothetical protein